MNNSATAISPCTINIVEPYARILNSHTREEYIQELRRSVEFIGRISHRSEDAQTSESWEKFLKFVVMVKGDWSIVEHVMVSVDFLVDRGITHEIVRHRLASYTQESTRFVNYEKKMPASFIYPLPEDATENQKLLWRRGIEGCVDAYKGLVGLGVSPQIARSVLPTGLASRIVMTCNLRNWRHFFMMRTTMEAHPQMRQVVIPLLREFQQKIPLFYDDIQPGVRQAEGIAKAR